MLNLHSRTAKACHMQLAVAGKTTIFAYIYVGGANCHIQPTGLHGHIGGMEISLFARSEATPRLTRY